MQKTMRWLLPIFALLIVVGAIIGYQFYQQLTRSVEVTGPITASVVMTPESDDLSEQTLQRVADRLRAARLSENGAIDSTGVQTHLQRLQDGEVDANTLLLYADDLQALNQFTAEQGALIPADFWDSQTQFDKENGVDEYTLVRESAMPGSEPYIGLLAQAYARFLAFKELEAGGEDTALDAALDILLLMDAYDRAIYGDTPAEGPEELAGRAQGKIMIWQSLIAGTSRINPLTGEALFSHGIFGHNSVPEIWRHAQDEGGSVSEIWGLTGFDDEFVGTPRNANQIEHMSISAYLQMVLDEPLTVLNAIEEEKVLLGKADEAEANADMALNRAIHEEFAPIYTSDGGQAVEQLRCFLKDGC
jgi:hypothetical protein